jgi:hypothetical protein
VVNELCKEEEVEMTPNELPPPAQLMKFILEEGFSS